MEGKEVSRLALWSCGGGRQSAGLAALIKLGKLPKPDHVCMVRLEWEIKTVWPYVNKYIRPALKEMGIPFTEIIRKDWCEVEFWDGENDALLLPVYSNKSGEQSKLPEWCSGRWKRDVVTRWAADQGDWKERGVDMWIGISAEEKQRRRRQRRKWIRPIYPLLDMIHITVVGCLQSVEKVGWPAPPRSRCRHCPNQSDREWAELTPKEFKLACDLEDEIREKDEHAFFHKKMIPLRMVKLEPKKERKGFFTGGCSAGMCY